MADDNFAVASPQAMAVASAAILQALLRELINAQHMKRADVERVLGEARKEISRHSTHGVFGEARTVIGAIQDRLPE